MGSKSKTEDKTSTSNTTTVVDRKATQETGLQILDSIVVSNDDKVIKESLAGVRSTFELLVNGNKANGQTLLELADKVMVVLSKGQAEISSFGMAALENAMKSLKASQDQGKFVLEFADETVGKTLDIATQVARDQATAQRDVLEVLADTKTGDYADNLKAIVGMTMLFTLAALALVRKK